MAQNDNVVFKTSTTATINDLFNWNKSTGQITAKTDSIPIVPGTVYFTADGHIVHDLTQNNRLWMSKNAYSAIYAKDISETNTDIANTIKYSIHYVEGPTTDTTAGTWTGTINGITELYDGLTIIYVPAIKGGSSTTTLNINGLGAKTCYYNNTSIITTHYSAGTPILLTYRNNCWRRADYNSNTTYSAMSVAEMRTGTATSERSIRADYLKTFLSTLGGTNLTLTHSNSAPYLQLNHDPSGITAGTYGNNSQQNPSYGGTFNIPYFTVDTQGHITNASVTTVKIPESDNTDYKVRQTSINSNDNNNYRILLSNSANDTSEDSVSKKNANLIYNPTENKLSTGNIKLTGELDVTGNVYLRNQTAVDSLTAGSLIVNGNSTFNNDINLAQGAVKWTSNSLPSVTSANYFLVIDAFANGGATKYITKADAIKSLISSSAIGSSTKPVYWTGSAFSAITSYSGAAALTGTPTAPTAAAGTNTTQIATTEFVTNAVAQGFVANDAMVFKGLIGSNQPITQLPTSGYNAGWTYRVANAGIFAGEYCEVGDLLIAIKDGPTSGSSVINTDWGKVEHNIDGAVFRGSGASNNSVGSSTQPVYVNSSGIVTAITGAIANDITGNAATASALTINAGNNEQLIYFSNGIPTVSSWKILADNHPTFLYQYSSTYTTTVKPQNEDWYVKITLNRAWNPNLMNLVITANYSNRKGVLYLDCDSYTTYWRAYLTNYGGTNIKAIKREWDGQNKKQIVYLKLAKVTEHQDNIPQGTITIYSPINFSIEQIDNNIPTDLISLQYGYNSSTPITTTKDISGNYANLNKLFVLNNEIQIKNQNNNYSHTIKDYNSSLITDNRLHYLPNTTGWIVTSPTSGTGNSSTPIYIDSDGITRAITGTISNDTTGNAATATVASKLSNTSAIGSSTQPVYFNSSGQPVAVNKYERQTGKTTNFVPLVGSDGIMEIGKYIDFHNTSEDTSDYIVRITARDSSDSTNGAGLTLTGTTVGTFKGDLNGTATKATQDGNGNVITSTYLPLSGGTMTGNLQWNDLTALPSTTTTDYFLAIDSFANGGTTKYITKGNALKSLISSSSIGTSLRPVYWTGSSFSQVNWFPSYCTVNGYSKNNYNYHRIATLSIGGSTWIDRDAVLVIRSRYSTSNYGIVKISGKANNNQGLLDLSAYWLIRSGFEEDSILICRKRETTDTSLGDTQVDVYLKTPLAYPRICVYMLVGPSHLDGFQLINSEEKDNSVLSYNTSDAENPNVIDINNSDLKGSYEVYIRDKDENGNLLNSFSGYNPNNSNSQTTPTAQSQVYTHIKTALDAGSVSRAKKSSLISTNQNAIAYYTDTTGTFGQKASANGALYATSANGSLQWGTLPMAQGGTGATTAAGARTNLGLGTMATEAANNYIAKSVGTAKGDIIYWSAANTPARLNIGSVGQVLKVSSNGIPVWSNTDTLVKQTAKLDNKNYKILFTTSDSPTSGNANEAAYDTDITINPSTHTLTAAKFIGSLQGNADTATTLATGRTLKVNLASTSVSTAFDGSANINDIGVSGILPIAQGGTGQNNTDNFVKVYTRSQMGNSINYDNPGVQGLFEARPASEITVTGKLPGEKQVYYPVLSLKTENAMMQIAGSSQYNLGWWIRGRQAANVTLENIDWEQLVTNNGTWGINITGNADTATKATQDGNGNNIINTYLTKTAGVTNITWDNTNKKLIKTINNSNSDIVTLYAANLKLNNTAVYNTELEIKNIKIGNGSTSTSTKNVKLEYNETLETLNFVFS